jgi:hypothetical protein
MTSQHQEKNKPLGLYIDKKYKPIWHFKLFLRPLKEEAGVSTAWGTWKQKWALT